MTQWAVTWTATYHVGNVELIDADTPEEAMEIVHRKVTADHAGDAYAELEIDRPVPLEEVS